MTMNEDIKFYMSESNLSPVEYTWMDLSKYHLTQEIWDRTLGVVGSINLTDIKEHPLPFERMAVVTESPITIRLTKDGSAVQHITPNIDKSKSLITIVRESNILTYTLHFYMGKSNTPAVVGVITDLPVFENGKLKKAMHFKYETQFKHLLASNNLKEDVAHKIFAGHCLETLRKLYSLTVKPDPIALICRPYGDVAKNAKRRKKGKTQFWEWKTIEIKQTRMLPSAPQGGTHASPKPHERMGHWRSYKSGKRIFVKPHIVNKHKIPEEGYIFHDYIKGKSNEILGVR